MKLLLENWRKYLNEVDTPSDSSDNLAAAAKKTIKKNGEAALLDVFASLPDDIKSQMQAIATDIAIKTSKEEINEEFDDYYETPDEEDAREEAEIDILTLPAFAGAAGGFDLAWHYVGLMSSYTQWAELAAGAAGFGLGAGVVAGIIGVLVYRMLQDKARRPDSMKPRQENSAE